MLRLEHVRARRRGRELSLNPLSAAEREEAVSLAEVLIGTLGPMVGEPWSEVEAALLTVPVAHDQLKLKAALCHLLTRACETSQVDGADAATLRAELFAYSCAERKAKGCIDRDAVLSQFAGSRGATPQEIEARLFADLKGAERLLAAPPYTAESLVEAYEEGQLPAALLRATQIQVDVVTASPDELRAFFRKLKFHRLLSRVETTTFGHRLTIDGPAALFESSTRYGLELACLVPTLRLVDSYRLEAELLWGKERTPLTLKAARSHAANGDAQREPRSPPPPEVLDIIRGLERSASGFRARETTTILNLPGEGNVIPDLIVERNGHAVYLEVLGYWSRNAVFRRAELVRAGLDAPIIFCASSRLRVSEEILSDDESAAVLVFKDKIRIPRLVDKLERLTTARGQSGAVGLQPSGGGA